MKNIKEKLNENIIDDQKIDEGALDYQVKKKNDKSTSTIFYYKYITKCRCW